MVNVLLSGGLGSSFMLAQAVHAARGGSSVAVGDRGGALHGVNKGASVIATFVDYGQPAAEEERKAAELVSSTMDVDLYIMDGPCLSKALMNNMSLYDDVDMPDKPGHAMASLSGPRVLIGRNLMLVSIAAMFPGTKTVLLGCTADDGPIYGDCDRTNLEYLNNFTAMAYGVQIALPLHQMEKKEVAWMATRCLADKSLVSLTWSCYSPATPGVACGECNACKERKKALAVSGEEQQDWNYQMGASNV